MCRIDQPGVVIRPLIIEVFNNGKVSIVPNTVPGAELTIEELIACRDLIDLIIANPKNFHIVTTEEPVIIINCRECRKPLGNNTEVAPLDDLDRVMIGQPGYSINCKKENTKPIKKKFNKPNDNSQN